MFEILRVKEVGHDHVYSRKWSSQIRKDLVVKTSDGVKLRGMRQKNAIVALSPFACCAVHDPREHAGRGERRRRRGGAITTRHMLPSPLVQME